MTYQQWKLQNLSKSILYDILKTMNTKCYITLFTPVRCISPLSVCRTTEKYIGLRHMGTKFHDTTKQYTVRQRHMIFTDIHCTQVILQWSIEYQVPDKTL